MTNRGGSGILRAMKRNGFQVAEHNIILGLNIPNYPQTNKTDIVSGISIGEDVLSFTPFTLGDRIRAQRPVPFANMESGRVFFTLLEDILIGRQSKNGFYILRQRA
ncbi:hypothetical protein [Maribacter halichondriae]|uniref:hypothetical protein n=1 Tax=Maribacter halichondriae TaxID=2980554 RepID=UPI00235A261E|nr:hypothetical protein [Maribacter sp. Hal144]